MRFEDEKRLAYEELMREAGRRVVAGTLTFAMVTSLVPTIPAVAQEGEDSSSVQPVDDQVPEGEATTIPEPVDSGGFGAEGQPEANGEVVGDVPSPAESSQESDGEPKGESGAEGDDQEAAVGQLPEEVPQGDGEDSSTSEGDSSQDFAVETDGEVEESPDGDEAVADTEYQEPAADDEDTEEAGGDEASDGDQDPVGRGESTETDDEAVSGEDREPTKETSTDRADDEDTGDDEAAGTSKGGQVDVSESAVETTSAVPAAADEQKVGTAAEDPQAPVLVKVQLGEDNAEEPRPINLNAPESAEAVVSTVHNKLIVQVRDEDGNLDLDSDEEGKPTKSYVELTKDAIDGNPQEEPTRIPFVSVGAPDTTLYKAECELEDGVYTINIVAIDETTEGDGGPKQLTLPDGFSNRKVTIDVNGPAIVADEIVLSTGGAQTSETAGTIYENRTVDFTIKDAVGVDLDSVKVTATYNDADGTSQTKTWEHTESGYTDDLTVVKVDSKDTEAKGTVNLPPSKYDDLKISVEAKDIAGRTGTAEKVFRGESFWVGTEPEIGFNIAGVSDDGSSTSVTEVTGTIPAPQYINFNDPKLTISVVDPTLEESTEKTFVQIINNGVTPDPKPYSDFQNDLTLSDGKLAFYIKVTDQSGLVSTKVVGGSWNEAEQKLEADGSLVVDTTAPKLTVTVGEASSADTSNFIPLTNGETYGFNKENEQVKIHVSIEESTSWDTDSFTATLKKGSEEKGTLNWSPDSDATTHAGDLTVPNEEGVYTLTVTGHDGAEHNLVDADGKPFGTGDGAGTYTATIIIDRTPPEFDSITWDDGVAQTYKDTVYSPTRTATITVSEENSWDSLPIDVTYSGTTADGNVVSGTFEGNWSETDPGSGIYQNTVTFAEDGTYTITVSGQDPAGNEMATITKTFVIDSTAPLLTASIGETVIPNGGSGGILPTIDPKAVSLSINEKYLKLDANNNPDSVVVALDGDEVLGLVWDHVEGSDTYTTSVPFTEELDGQYVLTVSGAKDLAGNPLSSMNAEEQPVEGYSATIFVDNTAPELKSVTWAGGNPSEAVSAVHGQDLNQSPLTATLTFEEEVSWNKSLISISRDGEPVPEADLSWSDDNLTHMHVCTVTFSQNENTEAEHTLRVSGGDEAGLPLAFSAVNNPSVGTIETEGEGEEQTQSFLVSFFMDRQSPEVTLAGGANMGTAFDEVLNSSARSYVEGDEGNEKTVRYLNLNEFLATASDLRMSEGSGDSGYPKVSLSAGATPSSWGTTTDETSKVTTYTSTLQFPDGPLAALIDAKDKAGNESKLSYGVASPDSPEHDGEGKLVPDGTIVVDATPPQLEVKLNDTLLGAGVTYTKATANTLAATIEELNWDADLVTAKLNDSPITSGFTNEGTSHTCSLQDQLQNEGRYTFTISERDGGAEDSAGADKAGNHIAYTEAMRQAVESDFDPSEGYQATLVVDRTSPMIVDDANATDAGSIQWSDEGEESDTKPGYFNGARTATITIYEELSWGDELTQDEAPVKVEVTGEQLEEGAAVPAVSKWEKVPNRDGYYQCTVKFEKDGCYTLKVSGDDLAGNPLAGSEIDGANPGVLIQSFTIDAAQPSVDVAMPNFAKKVGEKNYYTSDVKATITVADRTVEDANSISVKVNGEEVDKKDLGWNTILDEVTGLYTHAATYSYTNDGTYHTPVVSVSDLFDNDNATPNVHIGNTKYEDGFDFIIDKTAPIVTSVKLNNGPAIEIEKLKDFYWLFNKATSMTLTIQDNDEIASVVVSDADSDKNGALYVSGSKYVGEFKPSGSQTGSLEIKLAESATEGHKADFGRDVKVTITDVAGHVRVWGIGPTGEVTDTIKSDPKNTPFEGQENHPYYLIQDSVAPVLSIVRPGTTVSVGKYYRTHDRKLVLKVVESNLEHLRSSGMALDPDRTVLTISYTPNESGAETTETTVSVSDLTNTGDDIEYRYTKLFDKDGHFEVEAQLTDVAGNTSNKVSIGSFTVDTKAPEMSVDWKNGKNVELHEEGGVKYYNGPRTATIKVVEHNFDESSINIKTNGKVGSWKSEGDVHYVAVEFTEDGDKYFLEVTGEDMAKNPFTKYQAEEFCIDRTDPMISVDYRVKGSSQKSQYAQSPDRTPDGREYYDHGRVAYITVREHNFDPAKFKITVKATECSPTTTMPGYDPTKWQELSGDRWRYVIDCSEDATYEIKVTGKDKASRTARSKDEDGNLQAGYKKSFVVDTENPEVSNTFEDVGGYFNLKGDSKRYFGRVIEVTTTIRDRHLNTDATYIVDAEGKTLGYEDAQWKRTGPDKDGFYTYTTTFSYPEGKRKTPLLVTEDLATNKSKIAKETEFVVDTTAPIITLAQLNDGETFVEDSFPIVRTSKDSLMHWFFNKATEIKLSVTELNAVTSVVVSDKNGRKSPYVKGASLSADRKTIRLELDQGVDSKFDRDISVTVTDVVGNYSTWSINKYGVVNTSSGSSGKKNALFTDKMGADLGNPFELVLDETAPSVKRGGTAAANKYYGSADSKPTVVVEVTEQNLGYLTRFGTDPIVTTIYRRDNKSDSKYAIEKVVHVSDLLASKPTDDFTYTYTYTCEADGHYYLDDLEVVDSANNKGSAKGIPEGSFFTVDTKSPVVMVDWENSTDLLHDEETGTNYYTGPRTATITVKEHNFDASKFTIDTNATSVGDWVSKGDVHTIEVQFTEDADRYYLTMTGEDKAKNAMQRYQADEFCIDQQDPEILVDYFVSGSLDRSEARPSAAEGDSKVYCAHPRTAYVTVHEHNFDPWKFTIAINAEQFDPAIRPKLPVYSPSNWQNVGTDTWRYTIDCSQEANYRFLVSGVDSSGRIAYYQMPDGTKDPVYDSGIYVVDLTRPEVSNSFESVGEWQELDGKRYFARMIEVTTTIRDRHIDTGQTAIADPDENMIAYGDAFWEVSGPDEKGIYTYTKTFTYPEKLDGDRKTPALHTADLAGNESGIDPVGFVVDLTAPVVTSVAVTNEQGTQIRPTTEGRGTPEEDPIQFFNQATQIVFSFEDEHLIDSVSLYDPDNEYVIDEDASGVTRGAAAGTVTIRLVDGTQSGNDTEFERREDHLIYLRVVDIAGNSRTWTLDRSGNVVDANASSSLNPSLNGEEVFPVSLVEDVTTPLVALSGVDAGAYYNAPQSVHAQITEFNYDYLSRFDPSRVVMTITKYEGNAGRAESSWTVPVSSFVGSRPSYGFDQPFEGDGHYVVSAQFRDFADNLSNLATIDEFTVDMTAPKISVEFDNNQTTDNANGLEYYGAERTATITVEEHNFNPEGVRIETTGTESGWTSNGDIHTKTVYYGEGQEHRLTVNATDLAGNVASEVTVPTFVVDLTDPTVEIAGTGERLGLGEDSVSTLADRTAYNGAVMPLITFRDNANLHDGGITYKLSSRKHGDIPVSVGGMGNYAVDESGISDNVKTVTFHDLGFQGDDPEEKLVNDYDVDVDDIYTLTANVTDRGGHSAEATLTFSVNRYGSNYVVTPVDADGRELKIDENKGMLSESPTIVVQEINVSGVASEADRHVSKEYANRTSPIRLARGPRDEGYDLTVRPTEGTQYGWAEYVYTIRSNNFGSESEWAKDESHFDRGQGFYRVNVMSDDTASNANTTAGYWESDDAERSKASLKAATEEFVLDEIGPVIESVGLPGLVGMDEYAASFHLTDDITLYDTIEVRVDGELVPVYTSSDLDPISALSPLDEDEVLEGVEQTEGFGGTTATGEIPVQQASFSMASEGDETETSVEGEAVETMAPTGPLMAQGTGTYYFRIDPKSFAGRNVTITVKDYSGDPSRTAEETNLSFMYTTLIAEAIAVLAVLAGAITGTVIYRRRKAAAEPDAPTRQ